MLPFPGDLPVTPERVREHKLSGGEWEKACQALGRTPSYTELGVLSVMWSEHCSYKSSRLHLRRLPTKGPRVIQGPGENAGVVDIGDGFAAVFKMESHNHPSFIEPVQGAATGVGGILRDVFTMGARPVACLDALWFGRPDHPRTLELLSGVVRGIGGYGNAFGVPTVGGQLVFDPAYDANILVNAFACGVCRTDRIFYGRAAGVGSQILYLGAKTGRDGIHGATMASDTFSESGPSQRPTMQVGDPFVGKLLLEACLSLFERDLLSGIQDMGAAGLTSSSVEMAGRGGSGIEIDLDQIPRRARGMSPYELLLSESQERMLLVARPGKEPEVLALCERWDLDCAVVGHVTDTGRWVVRATPGFDPLLGPRPKGEPITVCDLPVSLLTDDAPVYDKKQGEAIDFPPIAIKEVSIPQDHGEVLLALLRSPNVGSRAWVYSQYDHIVRGGTVIRPGGGAAVVRVPCERDGVTLDKFLAFSTDCDARKVFLSPRVGSQLAVAEACRNLVCVGAEPIGLTDCLNFANPDRPETMRQLSDSIDGLADACRALSVPIVSGNVSLYNETDGHPILPTPAMGAVGILPRAEDRVTPWFKQGGDSLVLLGPLLLSIEHLAGSEVSSLYNLPLERRLPPFDLSLEARLQSLVLSLSRGGLLASAQDTSEGGLAVCLAECLTMGPEPVGAAVKIPFASLSPQEWTALLFGEAPSRVLVSTPNAAEVCKRAHEVSVPACVLGKVTSRTLLVHSEAGTLLEIPVDTLRASRDACLKSIVERGGT